MYVGRLMEMTDTHELYFNPKHPYTEALMSAVPKPDPRIRHRSERIRLEGEVADPANPPAGCHFHPRCKYAQERCRVEVPAIRDVGGGHLCACHFAESLKLKGVVV
jgi:peptide/nickel transport system ATP-binding protein